MFENFTYEYLLQGMLDRVPNVFDKREGSMIYNAIAPSAAELAESYIMLDITKDELFASSCSYNSLVEKCDEYGIYPKPATNAIVKGKFNIDVPIGSRFTLDSLNFVVTEKISTGVFKLQCEDVGPIFNLGTLIPIDYIQGLETAVLVEILENGEDEESLDSLRDRYLNFKRKKPTSGNKNHYKMWALEVRGVGDCRVLPLWNGNGTVKVVIIDVDKNAATQELVEKVYAHIDEERPLLPGVLTVASAIEKKINISTKLILANGYNIQTVKENIEKDLKAYLAENAFKDTYISFAKIANVVFSAEGVLDYSELKVNNVITNIPLNDDEVAVPGEVTVVI
ncbi:MAG: baseplate J/gp47 family protein [Paraclostridium sp.]